ncbi:hypothetical protein CC78DRAFT_318793 [Lojkania enalia]|uniref:Core domain-containing protein n=1 Tax=Lojkania enalia TaxID=147567 RepID=A0A9P4KAJ1_9PLEO|nr:hypothetical protein CC78DRAFT_318793 [Didymosphaeria enalia]
MASPSMCKSCVRAAQRAIPSNAVTARIVGKPMRAYRTASSSAQQSLYLDFLAPSAQKAQFQNPSNVYPSIPQVQYSSRRAFASTAAEPSKPQIAHPIANPRHDETGKPMTISLSPRASHRLSAISSTDNNPHLALRITVESGGCHGFQYLMSLTDLFASPPAEDDCVFEGDNGAKVIIDEPSLELLNGSTVDYTMELIGSQFKVTGIPGATSSCGCGTSFDIKI